MSFLTTPTKSSSGNDARSPLSSPNSQEFSQSPIFRTPESPSPSRPITSPRVRNGLAVSFWKTKSADIKKMKSSEDPSENEIVHPTLIDIKDISPDNNQKGGAFTKIVGRVVNVKYYYYKKPYDNEKVMIKATLQDYSGEVSILIYDKGVERYKDWIQVNQVIDVPDYTVKNRSADYHSFSTINYDISLKARGIIVESSIPRPSIEFNFNSIEEVKKSDTGDFIDLLAVVCINWPTEGQGKDASKILTLTDTNLDEISITLYGYEAINFGDDSNCIIAIRRAKVMQSKIAMQDSQELESVCSLRSYADTLIWKKYQGTDAKKLQDIFQKALATKEKEEEQDNEDDVGKENTFPDGVHYE